MLSLLLKLLACHPAVLPFHFLSAVILPGLPAQILSVPQPARLAEIDRTANAVWLQHRWLQAGITEPEISNLCAELKSRRIRFIYPHLTPSESDGRLPEYSQETARMLVRIFRRECPDVNILPWVGGVRAGFRQMRPGTVDLDSADYLQRFAADARYLTEDLDFDGIHLNVEPVESGNTAFLLWLEELRKQLSPQKLLSVAGNKPSYIEGFNVSQLRSWDLSYYERVAKHCDQLVIMNYDTGINTPFLYSLFVQEKVAELLQRLSNANASCKILLGVPTYDDSPRHSAKAENIDAAVDGLRSVLGRVEQPLSNFQGIALYGYWTTDAAEWRQFQRRWVDGQQ